VKHVVQRVEGSWQKLGGTNSMACKFVITTRLSYSINPASNKTRDRWRSSAGGSERESLCSTSQWLRERSCDERLNSLHCLQITSCIHTAIRFCLLFQLQILFITLFMNKTWLIIHALKRQKRPRLSRHNQRRSHDFPLEKKKLESQNLVKI